MPGQGDTRGESTRTCSVTRCSCVGRKRGGKRGEGRAIPSAVSLWGTSPFADMRAEPPVGRRSPTHRRYEATAVAVLVVRAVEHRRRREGWRHAIGRQVDTALRQRCRRVTVSKQCFAPFFCSCSIPVSQFLPFPSSRGDSFLDSPLIRIFESSSIIKFCIELKFRVSSTSCTVGTTRRRNT